MGISKYNSEGYPDPTAYEAMTAVTREEKKNEKPYRPLVYICSPFAGDIERNTENARAFCRFAVRQGAIPLAPHLHYPQFMDESDPAQRNDGLWFAIILLCKTDGVWVFGERISEGMKREIAKARAKGIPIKFYNDKECEVITGCQTQLNGASRHATEAI